MKKLLIGVGIVLAVIVAGLFYVWTNLDNIVKTAIQTYGSQATKTAVRVDGVKIDLKQGMATITGLTVANPGGFTDPYLFKLGSISTKIDTSSLNSNPIVIDEIDISAPAVVYEINKSGVSNVDVIKKNLGVGSGGGESASSSGGSQLKMIIRKIVVEGSSAKVRIAALDKEQSVTLPRIVMTDVGKKSNGETAAQVAQQLSDKMLANVQGSVAKIGVDKYLGKSADAVKQQMQKSLGGTTGGGNVGGALKGLLGK
ncbi:MAG TPA: hypothetical protein VNH42_05355 [Mariprofundaceae bacterium]|nr:hypothetical protein [Mariprofundaceae bacterium]